jgi:hypothetical protein
VPNSWKTTNDLCHYRPNPSNHSQTQIKGVNMNRAITIDLDFFKNNQVDNSRRFKLTIDEQTAKEFFILINQTWKTDDKPDLIKKIGLSIWQEFEDFGLDLEETI